MSVTIGSSNFTILRMGETALPDNSVPATIKEIPMTGESFQFSSQFISSQNINSSRQVMDNIQTGFDTSGGIQIEFAPKVYDLLLAGALWADWGTETKVTGSVSIVKATRVVTITGGFTNIVEGQFFRIGKNITDTLLASDVGVYQVETRTSADSVIVKELNGVSPFPADVTAKTCHLSACMLRAPKNGDPAIMKRKEFCFEREHSDLTPQQFFAFTGNLVNSMSINAQSASLMTGSFDFIGKNSTIFNSGETGPIVQNGTSYTVAAGSRATSHADADKFNGFNAVSHIKQVILDGSNINEVGGTNSVYFQGIDFSLSNGVRGAQAIGVMGNVATMAGQLSVTGNISAYFANSFMYKKFLSGEEFPLSFSVFNEDGDGYVFSFPRVTISSSSMNAGGNDQDLVEEMQWSALYDNNDKGGLSSSEGYKTSIQIDRIYSW